jgi:hypothetical protein
MIILYGYPPYLLRTYLLFSPCYFYFTSLWRSHKQLIFQTAKRLGYFASLVLALLNRFAVKLFCEAKLPKPSCFVSRNYKIAKRKSLLIESFDTRYRPSAETLRFPLCGNTSNITNIVSKYQEKIITA